MSCPTCNSREKITQDLFRIIQAHVGCWPLGLKFFSCPVWYECCDLFGYFLPVSMTVSSFSIWHWQARVQPWSFSSTFGILCQGYLIYFYTSADDSQMPLIITPGSQYDSRLPLECYSPKPLYISYKLAKFNVLESPYTSFMKENLM